MIDKNSSLDEVASRVMRGDLVASVINRHEGKENSVKGVIDNAQKRSQMHSNLQRSLEFLRKFPKMNIRRLWDTDKILNGEEDAIWEFMLDLYNYYKILRKNMSQNTLNITNSLFKMTPKRSFSKDNKLLPEKPKEIFNEHSFLHNYSMNMSKILSENNGSFAEISKNIVASTLGINPQRLRQKSTFSPQITISEVTKVEPNRVRMVTFESDVANMREAMVTQKSRQHSKESERSGVSFIEWNKKKGSTVPKKLPIKDKTVEIAEWLAKIGIEGLNEIDWGKEVLVPFKDGLKAK